MSHGKARENIAKPYFDSWRSHLNAFKYMVDNDMSTALILGDDVDWDIRLKSQLLSLSHALRTNPLREHSNGDTGARYGTDWDMLHLGPSRNTLHHDGRSGSFYTYSDAWATPLKTILQDHACTAKEWFCWHDIATATELRAGERVIFPSWRPIGLAAIAVTLEGAKKLLYHLSWKGLDMTLDRAISEHFATGDLQGWSVVPPLMSTWVVHGAGDSDLRSIRKDTGKGHSNLEGASAGLAWSARSYLRLRFSKQPRQ